MRNNKSLCLTIISGLFLLLILSIYWGYRNFLRIKDLIKTNQDLMRVVREATSQKNKKNIEGESLSDFTIKTIKNQNIFISKKDEALLIFIDLSCGVCIDSLREIYKKVGALKSGLKIFAIGLSDEEKLKELERKIQLPIFFAQDTFSQLHRKFKIKGSPSMVYIKYGTIKLIADPFNLEVKLLELVDILKKSEEK